MAFYMDGKVHRLGDGQSREELLQWVEWLVEDLGLAEGTLRTIFLRDKDKPFLDAHCRKLVHNALQELDLPVRERRERRGHNMWVLQQNYCERHDRNGVLFETEVLKTLKELNIPYVVVDPIPFSDGEFRTEPRGVVNPCVVYGTNALIKASVKRGWRPGAFFYEKSTVDTWTAALFDHVLNPDAKVTTFGKLEDDWTMDCSLFVRPVDDFKGFEGQVMTRRDAERFAAEERFRDLKIVVASPKKVGPEWRVFMVGNKPVAASMYRPTGDGYVPPDVYEFARTIDALWHPGSSYVMDVCDQDGTLKVVEFNCITGSGYYRANVRDIVLALTYQENP